MAARRHGRGGVARSTSGHSLFPKRAVVERLTDDGRWETIPMPDELGNDQHVFPDENSALLALVRYVHRQFYLVLRKELDINDVTPPDRFRITEIEEH